MEEDEMLMIKAKDPIPTFMASLFELYSEPDPYIPELLAFPYETDMDQLEWPALDVNTLEVARVLVNETSRVFKCCDDNEGPAAAAVVYAYAH